MQLRPELHQWFQSTDTQLKAIPLAIEQGIQAALASLEEARDGGLAVLKVRLGIHSFRLT